ncbi:probable E3 ubiquitin-protein ligase HIP1 [Telopea speciosissima]|uniref:probable E3 ubiquitin-protein ligase HIP1 n=1 Tax=Telopea speciosissima TaxID=54955 RepID=UPI001CC42090|nr:probable E3 ubiquitin-protein ligase HIP1 [Telopea speciosissima]
MQGQRSTVDNFPETFEFDHGSSPSNPGVNQQLFWNNMINPVESRLPEYILSPGETSIMYGNAVNQDGRSLSGWSLGEPSSRGNARSQARDETKTEHGWSSTMSAPAAVGSRLEERRFEPTSILSLESVNINLNSNQAANGPLFLHNSSSDGIAQNINLNEGYVESSSNGDQAMEDDASPHTFESGGSDMEQIPSGSGSSDPLVTAAGASSGYILEENDGRPGCSLDGRRLSCKRKALEGTSGQPSLGGGPSWFQQAESSAWHAVPARNNGASSSSVPTLENPPVINPVEQPIQRFGVGMRVPPGGHPASSVAVSGDSSQRNFRVRVNHVQSQDSVSPNPLLTGSAIRNSHVWASHQASRMLPFNQSSESRLSSSQANVNPPQSQSHVMHIPGLGRNVHPFPWNGSSNSRAGSLSSSPVVAGERSAALREEANPRSMPRTIVEHPMFVSATEMRTLAQDPTSWNLPSGNVNILGNAASTSRIGSSSGVHPSAPTWIPHPNPPSLHQQRLSEFVRRSLFTSESGAQASTFPALRSGPSGSSQEMVLPSGASHQGHHRPLSRSAFLTERQGDGVLGIPFSLRTLAAAGEGRNRLVSEIRNVLDLMRRGESLRFEDVLILDQSVFYGVADLPDRHRDMRLDVDNMSYEELLALEERIGNVNTGLSEETIFKCLKQRKFLSISLSAPTEVEPCCICQEEYVDGEDIGTLDCGHDYHTGCIKQWLMQKNLCPICKMAALIT